MKSLERKAEKYDNGISTITLGKLPRIKQFIVNSYLKSGDNLLDLGMGTGTFAVLCAKKGVKVIGIDFSDKMLEIANKHIKSERLNDLITIIKMPVVDLDERFSNNSFDKITAILSFSEFYFKEQEYVLTQIFRILKNDGEFILVDEVKPKKLWKRIIYFIIRIPLSLIVFIRSHIAINSLKNIEQRLKDHNFQIIEEKLYLLDTLKLLRAKKNLGG